MVGLQNVESGTAIISTGACVRGTPTLTIDPASADITIPADVVDVSIGITATITNNDLYVASESLYFAGWAH